MEPNTNIQPLLHEQDDTKSIERSESAQSLWMNNTLNAEKNRWCCFFIHLPSTGKLERKTLTWIMLILIIDAVANLLLFFITQHWWFLHQHSATYFTWHDLYLDFTSFYSGTSDTMLLWIIRTLALFILSCLAISNGVPRELWNDDDPNICCCSLSRCCQRRSSRDAIAKCDESTLIRKPTDASIQRLLSDDHDRDAMILSSNIKSKSPNDITADEEEYVEIEGIEDKSALLPKFNTKDDEDSYRKRKAKCSVYKYGTLFVMFMLCTVFQGYIGIKCVRFNFTANVEIYQALCYGCIIICINIEIFLFKSFVESATDLGDRIVVPSIHPHALKFMRKVNFWCDLCRGRTKYGSYRCDACNFDLCRICFKKEKKKLLKKQQRKQAIQKQGSMQHGGKLKIHMHAASESYQYQNAKYNPENDPTLQSQKELTAAQYVIRGIRLMKPHSVLIFTAFVCLTITSAANLLLPRSQGKILDQIVDNDRAEFTYQIKFYVVLSAVIGFFGSVRNLCFAFIMRRLTVSIRSLMFRNIMVQNIEFFDEMSTGELISRMSNDVRGMLTPLRTMLTSTLSNIILLFGGLVMCFITSWRLSMLAFTTVAPVLFLTGQYAKWSKNINRAIWAAFGSSTQIATQAFSNIRTVRAFGTEQREITHYDNALQEILERGLIDAVASTATFALTNYLDLGAGVLILYFGGSSIFSHNSNYELTIGKLITFQLYWNMINNAYKGLQNVLTSFTSGAGAAQRVITLLDRIGNNPHNLYSGEYPKQGLDGHIFIENVHFHYKSRSDNVVLDGIDLEIKPDEVVAVVGRSGGGKSTLIHLLLRFYDVTKGQILYNKERIPLPQMNLTDLRQEIGLVAQDTQLFDCTIKENMIYGVEDEDELSMDEITHCAKLANCHEFIEKFEDGYDTRVGERGIRLSGGQKQRIAIARMLMKRPKILFLDEATSNLDTESEALVQAAIDKTIWYKKEEDDAKYDNKEEHKYKFKANAVILVAHRLSTVMNADKIAVIDKGKIVELGSHEQLLENKEGVYYRLVERQIQREQNQLNQNDDDKTKKKSKTVSDDIDSLFDNND
eukprot:649653_1